MIFGSSVQKDSLPIKTLQNCIVDPLGLRYRLCCDEGCVLKVVEMVDVKWISVYFINMCMFDRFMNSKGVV